MPSPDMFALGGQLTKLTGENTIGSPKSSPPERWVEGVFKAQSAAAGGAIRHIIKRAPTGI